MASLIGGVFNFTDRLQAESLNHRLKRNLVIAGNIANAETPGFRALGYDFEDQLQEIANVNGETMKLKVTNGKHFLNDFTNADGSFSPDVYVQPTESVANDGNTVDIDKEMASLAENQILYRAAVELINKKVGILRYAINGGR